MNGSLRAVLLISVVLLAACEEEVATAPEPVGRIEAVSPAEQAGTVAVPLGTPVAVRVLDVEGDPIPGATVHWQVTWGGGSVSVATSQTDAQGGAQALWTLGEKAGPNALAAIAGAHSVSFAATGEPGPAASVEVRAERDSLMLAEQVEMRATPRDAHGNAVPAGAVAWSSSDTMVAKVDPKGLVAARSFGTATIAASVAGVQGSARVHVRAVPPTISYAFMVAHALTSTSATLAFYVRSHGAAGTAWVEYATSPTLAGAASTAPASLNRDGGGDSPVLAGLTPGATYYYRVVARNDAGTVTGPVGSFRTAEPEPARLPQARFVEDSFLVRVSWQQNPDQVATLRIEHRDSHEQSWSAVADAFSSRDSITSQAVVRYASPEDVFRVVLCNSLGCSTSGEVQVQTRPLPPPANVAAQVLGPSHVMLTWNVSPQADEYYVLRLTGGGSGEGMAVLTRNQTSFTDLSAPAGRTFTYRVYAIKNYRWIPGIENTRTISSPALVTVTTPPQ
jgi:Bacterial Ig-like domain (group 2)